MAEELDETICKQMSSLVELLTTSGKPSLNPEVMKKFKKICRTSDGYVKHAFDLLMKQLRKKHSEVRLSVYQMVDELFQRSHMFRELLLEELQTFVDFTTGLDKKNPLPAPKAVAKTMSKSVLRSVYLWYEKYGPGYKKLALGYEYLKNCKKVDFDSVKAEIELERQQQAETERKLDAHRQEKLQQVSKEYSESETDIQLCMTEIENGLELLMPKPDDFFIPLGQEDDITHSGTGISSQDWFPVGTATTTCSGITPVSSSQENTSGDLTDTTCKHKTTENSEKDLKSSYKTEVSHGIKNYCSNGSNSDCAISNESHDTSYSSSQSDKSAVEIKNQNKTKLDIENNEASSDSDGDEESDMESGAQQLDEHGSGSEFTQEHGLFSHKFALTINVGVSETGVQENEDNVDIIQGVRDQYRLIKTKYMPRVKKWLKMLDDNNGKVADIKQMTEMKEKLENALKKCLELEISVSKRRNDNEEESEDDFEEVPEKEGYEEDVPEHVQLEAASSSAGTSKKSRGRPKMSASKKKVKQTAKEWFLSEKAKQELIDNLSNTCTSSSTGNMSTSQDTSEKSRSSQNLPSTSKVVKFDNLPSEKQKMAQNSKKGNKTDTCSSSKTETVTQKAQPEEMSDESSQEKAASREDRKAALLKKAPLVSFGVDLEHWEDRGNITVAAKVKYDDASRFWVPELSVDDKEPGGSEEVAALTRRAVTYAGKFEPVKWKCRAPLSNGNLCERMDRVKCPFHGKVIGRDETGQPTEPEEIDRDNRERIIREIEQGGASDSNSDNDHDTDSRAKGQSKGRGKGKGKRRAKKRKYPNLTDIQESKDNSRTRIEAKIFKRSTLKKVNAALDAAVVKKLNAKFANQFNYSLK